MQCQMPKPFFPKSSRRLPTRREAHVETLPDVDRPPHGRVDGRFVFVKRRPRWPRAGRGNFGIAVVGNRDLGWYPLRAAARVQCGLELVSLLVALLRYTRRLDFLWGS